MTVLAVPIVFVSVLFVSATNEGRKILTVLSPAHSTPRVTSGRTERGAWRGVEEEGVVSTARMTRQHGNGMERRMYINNPKLATCNMEYGQSRTSQPSPRLIIQIVIVLHVSVILRVVADTCRVTLRPKKLKKPMENATATDEPRTRRLEMVWCHPRGRSN